MLIYQSTFILLYMKTLNLKPASGGRYNHNFNPSTIGSFDLGDLPATLVIDTVPSRSVNVQSNSGRVRLARQVFPPYGKLWVKHASFFVPEQQLIEHSEAVHNKKSLWKGKAVVVPHFVYQSLVDGLSDSRYSTLNSVMPQWHPYLGTDPLSPDDYDFPHLVKDSNNRANVQFRLFTQLGRRLWKIFKSLGYDFDFPHWYANAGTALEEYNQMHADLRYNVSALPLLAYLKIYVDFFLSGSFYNNNPLVKFLQQIHDNEDIVVNGVTLYTASTGLLNMENFLGWIEDSVLVPHEDNIYTSAWNTPNSPDGTLNLSDVTPLTLLAPYLPQGTYNTDELNVTSTATESKNSYTNDLKYLSERGMMMLHAVYQFIERNNLAGTKDAQEFYARFGLKSEDFKTNFVHKLEDGAERIDFNAVMSNADTAGANVGSYAGFGTSGLNVNFNYTANDYGYIITLHWLQVEPIMSRGMDPRVLRIDGFDFWTPELDGKAQRAVPVCEVSGPPEFHQSRSKLTPNGTAIYGFINHGDDYRNQRDNVFGDMLRGTARQFYFARDFSYLRTWAAAFKPQSAAIQYYDLGDNKDITNPFDYYNSRSDRFWFFIEFNIDEESEILDFSSSQSLNGAGDIGIKKNGKMLS